MNGFNKVLVNFENTTVRFQFNAFYWSHIGVIDSRIYVHCCFEVCDPQVSENCDDDVSIVLQFQVFSLIFVYATSPKFC